MFLFCVISQLHTVLIQVPSNHLLLSRYVIFHIILGVWSSKISSCGANPENVYGLSRAVTPVLTPLSLCETPKNPFLSPPKALHLHNHKILIQAYVKLFFSTLGSTQALCLNVTLLSKPLKEDSDFSNCRKRFKVEKKVFLNFKTENRTFNTLSKLSHCVQLDLNCV